MRKQLHRYRYGTGWFRWIVRLGNYVFAPRTGLFRYRDGYSPAGGYLDSIVRWSRVEQAR